MFDNCAALRQMHFSITASLLLSAVFSNIYKRYIFWMQLQEYVFIFRPDIICWCLPGYEPYRSPSSSVLRGSHPSQGYHIVGWQKINCSVVRPGPQLLKCFYSSKEKGICHKTLFPPKTPTLKVTILCASNICSIFVTPIFFSSHFLKTI